MLFTRRRMQKPRTVLLLRKQISWVDTAHYLGMPIDKRLTWSCHIDQVRKKAAHTLGALESLLNRRSGLSIRKGVLLYRQLTRPTMDYACPVWRSAARSNIRKLQALQSTCLRIATGASWNSSNRQNDENLVVPFFTYHIIVLTESFDSKLAVAGNSLIRQLGRYLRWSRVTWPTRSASQGCWKLRSVAATTAARPTNWIAPKWHFSSTLTEVFPWFFLTCKTNATV
jgi:hypothetical protein